MDPGLGAVGLDSALEAGRQAGVDLVVPTAADAPARGAVGGEDFAGDGVGGGGGPAAGFKVEGAEVAGGVVFDFHEAVVVDGGGAGDDADNGGGYFLPCIQFLGARRGAQFEEPGPERVNVKGFAVELGLDGGLALSRCQLFIIQFRSC